MASKTIVQSGRAPLSMGARHLFGLTINAQEILEFFHEVIPTAPIPKDAKLEMLGFEDKGIDSIIEFYFSSFIVGRPACYFMKMHEFFSLLKKHGEGIIPSDAELDGIEASGNFNLLMLRVKSDKFPPHPGDKLPMAHIRFQERELILLNPWEAIFKDRRIRIK